MKIHKSSNRDNEQKRNSNQSQNDSTQLKTKTADEIDAPFGEQIDWQQTADNSPQVVSQLKRQEGYYDNQAEKKNITDSGLPENIALGVKQLSGMDISDTKVHYDSSEPAKVGAHAYAQGSDIYVAQGQEKHLAHEAWHIAQQKQNRVKPTTTENGQGVNDDENLETEADVKGAEAAAVGTSIQRKIAQKKQDD